MSPYSDKRSKTPEEAQSRFKKIADGVYVVKGAAPKAGTKLTPERIVGNFRSLNRRSRGTATEG